MYIIKMNKDKIPKTFEMAVREKYHYENYA
jgi:hypothetical protein